MVLKMNVKDKLLDDTLDLSCCDLKEVPVREIASLKRAKTVDLSNNVLVTLPKNFVTLTQIVKLDLSKNMLIEIPENFGEMTQLRHLDLYKNQISRLPLSLGNLKHLRWLDLKENPLSPAVAKVAGPCTTPQDCQSCAKNVVNYLVNAKLAIEEEQKRLTAIAAENEKPPEKLQTIKKDGKKKKKKEEKKTTEKEKPQKARVPEKTEPKTKTKSRKGKGGKEGVFSTCCRYFMWLVFWQLFFACVAFSVLALLPFYDKQMAKVVYDQIEVHTGLPVHEYHKIGTEGARILAENSKVFANRVVVQTRQIADDVYRLYLAKDASDKEL